MTPQRIVALALASAGGLALVASLCWWWLSYGEVYRYDYLSLGEASLCLVGDSEICRLATSLCRGKHATNVLPYSSVMIWVALGFLCASLVIQGGEPLRTAPGTKRSR